MADNLKIDMSKYTHIDDNGNIINPSNGMLDSIVNSAPMNALLGFGDAAGNLIRGGLHAAGKPFGTSFDPATLIQQNRNSQGNLQFEDLKSGQGGAYNIGNIAGNVATPLVIADLLGPTAGLGAMGEALPGILKLAPQIAGWSALGAAGNPNNPQKGLAEGAIGGAIGESIAPLARGVGKLADALSEKFYPKKFSKELVDKLRKDYSKVDDKSTEMYNTVLDKYKKDVPENYLYNPQETTYKIDPYYLSDPDLKTDYKNFLKSPTIDNAHSLKSTMGSLAYDLDSYNSSATERRMGAKLKELKDQFGNIINNVLESKNKNDASLYKDASDYFRDQLVPYRENKNLYNIVSNKERAIDPSDLSKALEDVSNQTRVPENHFISQANQELNKRLFGGEILGKTLQKTPGGQMIGPGMASILSSPTIRNFAQRMQSPYDKAKYAMLANLLQGNQ
ncbi:MAG: hypothetical protein E6R13_00690 [Spirochaetes bacterium]|nr:MAG: hypothetical protein E6R13_00690 [Spirochaetota bacterium]